MNQRCLEAPRNILELGLLKRQTSHSPGGLLFRANQILGPPSQFLLPPLIELTHIRATGEPHSTTMCVMRPAPALATAKLRADCRGLVWTSRRHEDAESPCPFSSLFPPGVGWDIYNMRGASYIPFLMVFHSSRQWRDSC